VGQELKGKQQPRQKEPIAEQNRSRSQFTPFTCAQPPHTGGLVELFGPAALASRGIAVSVILKDPPDIGQITWVQSQKGNRTCGLCAIRPSDARRIGRGSKRPTFGVPIDHQQTKNHLHGPELRIRAGQIRRSTPLTVGKITLTLGNW